MNLSRILARDPLANLVFPRRVDPGDAVGSRLLKILWASVNR
jgi:hypothetical protein